jgi:hypothetical protein
MGFIRKRLSEPSTWAAIGILFQIVKVNVPPQYHAVVDCASGLLAAAAGVTPEATK